MAKTRKFKTIESRNSYIIGRLNSKVSQEVVANEVGLSSRQIGNIHRAYKVNGRLRIKQGSGRPTLLTAREKLRLSMAIRRTPTRPLAYIIKDIGLHCSRQTAWRYLKSHGYSYRKSVPQPLLIEDHIEQRLDFYNEYEHHDFGRAVFVDEALFQVGHHHYGWVKDGEALISETTKYPPRVGVWAAIDCSGKLALMFYENTLDQNRYMEILQAVLYPEADLYWGKGEWDLVQDNASCHIAGAVIEDIEEHAREVIQMPSSSPDLNPIENFWGILKSRVAKRNPKNKDELKRYILKEYDNIEDTEVSKIARSMAARVRKLGEVDGAYTGY